MKILQVFVLVIGLFILSNAQENVNQPSNGSTIMGKIFDQQGSVIPEVKVVFTSESGKSVEVKSDGSGSFRLELGAGAYRAELSRTYFTKYTIAAYTIPLKTSVQLDVTLAVEPIVDRVTVSDPQAHKQVLILGTVYDPEGAIIAGTHVSVSVRNGSSLQTKTDRNGLYQFRLTPGDYTVEFESPGFKKMIFQNFSVVNSTFGKFQRDIVMEIGSCSACHWIVGDPVPQTKKP